MSKSILEANLAKFSKEVNFGLNKIIKVDQFREVLCNLRGGKFSLRQSSSPCVFLCRKENIFVCNFPTPPLLPPRREGWKSVCCALVLVKQVNVVDVSEAIRSGQHPLLLEIEFEEKFGQKIN